MAFAPSIGAETSSLWGTKGEFWDPGNSRLLNFSDVGYKQGDVPIPDWPVGVNVTDFGAVAGDGIDDSQAFNDAIAACPLKHAVFVPNGQYTILQKVFLNKDYIVLRGEDMYATVLFMPKNLSEVYIMEEGKDPNDPKKRNIPSGAFFEVRNGTHRSFENLTFRFRDQMKMNHWEHKGNDALKIMKASNCWVRNVCIVNADHGLMVANVEQSSFLNIIFDHFHWRQGPQSRQRVGHMAIKPNSTKCLYHNIEIRGGYSHDFDIDGGTVQNVFSNVTGTRPQFAAHGPGAHDNLHTQVDHGWSTRLTVAKKGSRHQIFWNVFGDEKLETASIDKFKEHVFVGYDGDHPTTKTDTFWYENIGPEQLTPQNIYLAQLKYFGKPLPEGPPPPPPSDPGDVVYLLASEDTFTDFRKPDSVVDPHSSTLDARFPMYFKFDLRDIDLESIHRVRMVVGVNRVSEKSKFTIASVNQDNWSEDTMSYNNRPLPQDNLDTVQFDELSMARKVEFDVTPFVQAEWTGDKIVSLNMVRDAGGGNVQSRDLWWPPTLIIEQVEDPVPGAPSAPTGITTESLVGNIRLDWDDNPEADVATYDVYRDPFSENEDGYNRPIAMGLVTSDFVDVDSSGDWRVGMMDHNIVYRYRIVAVDQHGNESPKSVEVEGTVLPPNN